MHRLPLITEDASDPEYKRLHPYSCTSVEEFLSYNIGKQRAYEVCITEYLKYFHKEIN